MQATASLEQFSKHPLAGAVIQAARDEKMVLLDVSEIRETPGEGLQGMVGGRRVRITGRAKIDPDLPGLPPPSRDWNVWFSWMTGMRASFRFHDAPRQDTKPFVHHLVPRHHVNRVMLVSGDRESEVRYLADQVGITEVYRRPEPGAEGRDRGARNRASEDAVHRRRDQRCAGTDGSHGWRGVRSEQRHHIRGCRCGHINHVTREGRRTDSHQPSHALHRPAKRRSAVWRRAWLA